MRRDISDDLLRSLLAFNAALGAEVRDVRRLLAAREAREAKANPNWRLQPRAPRGTREGGQWIDSAARLTALLGGARTIQAQAPPGTAPQPAPQPERQVRPPPVSNDNARPSSSQRDITRLDRPTSEESDIRAWPLRLFRLSPVTLALPLYGDTPRPEVATRLVPGASDLVLVVTTSRTTRESFASFQRIVQPERLSPWFLFGFDTGVEFNEPATLEVLNVGVRVEDDAVIFDRAELAREYGRAIAFDTTPSGPPLSGEPTIPPVTPAEHLLDHNLRELGASQREINVALLNLRHSEDDESLEAELAGSSASTIARTPVDRIEAIRDELKRQRDQRNQSGIAYSSQQLPVVEGRWLRGTHRNAGVIPEQVARRLRGRTFRNFREFREEFWMIVADTPELARQFSRRNQRRMRRGLAPRAPQSQRYGAQITHLLHHRRTISRGGEVYDMSNIIVVTPRTHLDILDRRIHFRPPEDSE